MPQHHPIGHTTIWQMRAGAVPSNSLFYCRSFTALPTRSALMCWSTEGQDPVSSAATGNGEEQLPGLQWVLRSRREVRTGHPPLPSPPHDRQGWWDRCFLSHALMSSSPVFLPIELVLMVCEGQGQCSVELQPERDGANSVQSSPPGLHC